VRKNRRQVTVLTPSQLLDDTLISMKIGGGTMGEKYLVTTSSTTTGGIRNERSFYLEIG
jgi:hypothetical protein